MSAEPEPDPAGSSLPAVDRLLSACAVREAAERIYASVAAGESEHFALDSSRLPLVADQVAEVTEAAYPERRAIPFHSRLRHFQVGGVDRLLRLEAALRDQTADEQRRAWFDLVMVSVLLDAGAGPEWKYRDASGLVWSRSEGLAVASFDAFMAGRFSRDPRGPRLWVDATRLTRMTASELGEIFQVTADNPLLGLSGRLELLHRLGRVVEGTSEYFGSDSPRPGHLADHLRERAAHGSIAASQVLTAVLRALGPVWPGRVSLGGVACGDLWVHSRLGPVPFHKLSQWLSYSICECLGRSGLEVTGVEELTGLAEYRNGGLFVDLEVLVPKHLGVLNEPHPVDSDLVIEWRALTVALLDRVAALLRQRWALSEQELPLAKVLEGGTWRAGRLLALERRADGAPPISVHSDGTVF